MNGVTVTVGAAAGLVLLFALGAATGALAVVVLHAGNVGRYDFYNAHPTLGDLSTMVGAYQRMNRDHAG